jgi:hypothetical protein
MPVFFSVLGLYPVGVGGDQTREGSVEAGSAPPRRFGGAGVGFGRDGV